MNFIFKCTCAICPEQYDVYVNDETTPCGYVRLRHGNLTASYKNNLVYSSDVHGDGCFEDTNERHDHLQAISEIFARERCEENNIDYYETDDNISYDTDDDINIAYYDIVYDTDDDTTDDDTDVDFEIDYGDYLL